MDGRVCHTFSVSSFSGKFVILIFPLFKKTQVLSLLPVSRRFTPYQSWLCNLIAYVVGLSLPRRSRRRHVRAASLETASEPSGPSSQARRIALTSWPSRKVHPN